MPNQQDKAPVPAPQRRPLFIGVALAILGLIAGIAVAETMLRLGKWRPAHQIVRGFGLHSVDGVPVWEQSNDRHHRACVEQHPERIRILFFGSSITFGVSLTAAETFTSALEARLNQLRPSPGFCVLNFAQPGFAFQQKYVVARQEIPRYKPVLVLWEDWVEWPEYVMIGEAAYGKADLLVREDGFIGIQGVPDGLNRVLFGNSRLYEYLTLAIGERAAQTRGPNGIVTFADTQLTKVLALSESVGARLVMFLAPPLDQPFAETAATLPDWHTILLDFAQQHDVPAYVLQRVLANQDYQKLRLDPCCHFNAEGHRALTDVMQRIVLEQLDAVSKPAS